MITASYCTYCTDNYRGLNEREWRHIPSNKDLGIRHHIVLPNQDIDDLYDLSDESNKMKNKQYVRLEFDLNEVKYVIIKSDNDVRKIGNMIKGNSDIEIKTVREILETQ